MGANDDSNVVGSSVTIPRLNAIRKATLAETYQYLYELINGKSVANLSDLVSEASSLSLFDESLRLMLVDHFQLENEVVKILLSQNDYQIRRILNCKWYVNSLWRFFRNLSSDFCAKQLFPFVSQSLRCKIINKLSRHLENVDEAEKYFAYIRANYDNARADFMLPKCSPQFILNHFEKNKFTFKETTHIRIFFNICRRHPEVGIRILSSIFETKNKHPRGIRDYDRILSHLCGRHPDLMLPFLRKHRKDLPDEIFGRKLTRKLATRLKDEIFPEFVEKLLFKEAHLFGMLSWERKIEFVASLVRYKNADLTFSNWRQSDYQICRLLKLLRQDCRPAFVEAVFKEVYNSNFKENSHVWSREVLELFSAESRRPYASTLENLLKSTRSEFTEKVNSMSFVLDNPEGIISLHESPTAFPKFKELLRKASSVWRRENILCHMVKNCSINNDVRTLGEVVEFVASRHRNDDPNVIYRFLEVICEHFPAAALNSEIFEKLENLVYFLILKGNRNDYVYKLWRERHIYYRLENGMEVDDHVKNLFDSSIAEQYHYGAFLGDLRNAHSKRLIVDLCKKAADTIGEKPLDDKSSNLLCGVLNTCSEFNKQNKNCRIYLRDVPGLGDILYRQLKKNYGDAGGADWSLDVCERYYAEVLNSYYKPKHLLYSLKRRQDLIEKHMEGILNILFSDYIRTYNAFLNYFIIVVSFLGKTDWFKEVILNEFKNGASVQRRKTALSLYSRACTSQEFTEAIKEYIPRQEKIGSDRDFDEIQISIPPLIKNVLPRWRNLQLLLKFFFGDFLKNVLTSYFSCCHHTRCDKAIPFLKQHLSDVPQRVSYKKDIIRLILQLSDRKGRSDFCSSGWKAHEHYSLRGIFLREISKMFLDQPSPYTFETLEKCILECDTAIIDLRPSLSEIPEEYWNDYVSALWRFSEGQEPGFRNEFRRALLLNVDGKNIGLMSRDLSEVIIKSDLFIPPSEIEVERFTALYLAADPSTVEDRVHMLLALIEDRKADAASVKRVLESLMDVSWEQPARFAEVFAIILQNWPGYPLGVLYKERVRFAYHNLHQNAVKRSDPELVAVEFGRELRGLFASLPNLKDLVPIYSEALLQFFCRLPTSEAVRAVRELVSGSGDRSIAVLAISCLPDEAVAWHRSKDDVFNETRASNKKMVAELVEVFESYGDEVVDIYLRAKFEF